MREFWEKQSLKKVSYIHSISNLTKNQEFSKEKSIKEMNTVEEFFQKTKSNYNSCIEIGAGTCQWTYLLSKFSKSVLASDISEGMLKKGKEYLESKFQSKSISYFSGDILNEESPQNAPYDLFFISGLILYLDEKTLLKLLDFINRFASKNSTIYMREPVGVKKKFILDNIFSKELQMNYSAIYRTEEDLLNKFDKINFIKSKNIWFHKNGSKFNRWNETRLKLFILRRIQK